MDLYDGGARDALQRLISTRGLAILEQVARSEGEGGILPRDLERLQSLVPEAGVSAEECGQRLAAYHGTIPFPLFLGRLKLLREACREGLRTLALDPAEEGNILVWLEGYWDRLELGALGSWEGAKPAVEVEPDAQQVDPLTGLASREGLLRFLARCLAPGAGGATVLFLDLDKFKAVNDTLGHATGDALLRTVARKVAACVRPVDCVGRLGGDEFAVVLAGIVEELPARRVCARIANALATSLAAGAHSVYVHASIGVAVGDEERRDAEDLLREADAAMYRAKSAGRGRVVLYDEHLHHQLQERRSLEEDLRDAIHRRQLRLRYLPVVDVGTGDIVGFEGLVRWDHAHRGPVAPAVFLPVAEEAGLALEVGRLVLEQALEAAVTLAGSGSTPPFVSVNVSPRQLLVGGFAEEVARLLVAHRVPPARLHVEITESALIEDAVMARATLDALRSTGVRVLLDDFGTGYSSLSHLHRFPLDGVKLDASLVWGTASTSDLARSIVDLARALRLRVVAEGVEKPEQLALVESLGCHEAQGYLFAPPLALEAAQALVRGQRSLGRPQAPSHQ